MAQAESNIRDSPGATQVWLLACRPKTLSASVAPVCLGAACALHQPAMRWDAVLAALLGALLLQISSNFANDLFDFEKGADTKERLGPIRTVQAGLITPSQMRMALRVALVLACLVGAYLLQLGGWPIAVIGVCSVLAALAYTGGPYPLGYHGLGDVFVFLFFGPVAVCGTHYVATGVWSILSFWVSLPVGLLAAAILVVNNLRDRETDAKAGKRTLAVRFGRSGTLVQYTLLLLGAYILPAALWWFAKEVTPAVLLPWLTVPVAVHRWNKVTQETGRALNASLVGTSQLLLLHSLLFGVGISWNTLFR